MNQRMRKMMVFLTLPIALVWAWTQFSSSPEPQPAPVPAAAASAIAAAVADSIPAQHLARLQEMDWGTDPYQLRRRRGGTSIAAARSWKLSGIVYNDNSPRAFINSKSVRVGDTVNGAVVVRISKHAVTLDHRGRQFEITVDKG